MSTTRKPQRHGVVKVLTLPHHAAALLEELAPNTKSYGMFLSELINAEAARREVRAQVHAQREQEWRQQQQQQRERELGRVSKEDWEYSGRLPD